MEQVLNARLVAADLYLYGLADTQHAPVVKVVLRAHIDSPDQAGTQRPRQLLGVDAVALHRQLIL